MLASFRRCETIMAEVLPSHWEQLELAGASPAEMDTLRKLATDLPDGYSVIHGVHWARSKPQRTVFGEIDFCVLAPSGRLLLIEQKNGPLLERDGHLFKSYGESQKNVGNQISRSLDNIRQKFKESNRGFSFELDYLIYCPEHRLQSVNAASLDRMHIVDATRHQQLAAVVLTLLGQNSPADGGALRQRIRDFLLDTWQLIPDVNAFISIAENSYTRLSGGLSTWVQRLDFSPYRLRVSGTAGSGKTQLALVEFRRSLAAGGSPLYVCFNNPLATKLRAIIPCGGRITTFHALCDKWVRAKGGQPDFTNQDTDFWPRMVRWAGQLPIPEGWETDSLIVDEGQDIEPAWASLLLRLLRPEGRALWLDDPMQNLYAKEEAALPGFAVLKAPVNHRSPWRIHAGIERLLRLNTESANPLPGYDPEYVDYADGSDILDKVAASVEKFLRLGFKLRDIAVISFQGRDKSRLCKIDTIGRHAIKRWTGDYDEQRQQVFTDGDLLIETVFRFKGHQAPAVIFAEIDFDDYDTRVERKMFCGMTRASVALDCLISRRAVEKLIARL